MRNARICILGVHGLTGEVLKNIVLAGVGSVTICDDSVVETRQLGAMFFLREDDVGKNVSFGECIWFLDYGARTFV
jgi:molybdopterin/thiamine biosynthesis adenylyltransferase